MENNKIRLRADITWMDIKPSKPDSDIIVEGLTALVDKKNAEIEFLYNELNKQHDENSAVLSLIYDSEYKRKFIPLLTSSPGSYLTPEQVADLTDFFSN